MDRTRKEDDWFVRRLSASKRWFVCFFQNTKRFCFSRLNPRRPPWRGIINYQLSNFLWFWGKEASGATNILYQLNFEEVRTSLVSKRCAVQILPEGERKALSSKQLCLFRHGRQQAPKSPRSGKIFCYADSFAYESRSVASPNGNDLSGPMIPLTSPSRFTLREGAWTFEGRGCHTHPLWLATGKPRDLWFKSLRHFFAKRKNC